MFGRVSCLQWIPYIIHLAMFHFHHSRTLSPTPFKTKGKFHLPVDKRIQWQYSAQGWPGVFWAKSSERRQVAAETKAGLVFVRGSKGILLPEITFGMLWFSSLTTPWQVLSTLMLSQSSIGPSGRKGYQAPLQFCLSNFENIIQRWWCIWLMHYSKYSGRLSTFFPPSHFPMTAIALAEMPIQKVTDQQIQLPYVLWDVAEVVVWRRLVFEALWDDLPSQTWSCDGCLQRQQRYQSLVFLWQQEAHYVLQ